MDPTQYASALMNGASSLGGSLTDPFMTSPNFVNAQYATPQQLASMRQYGDQLMKQSPTIHRPIQGIAQMLSSYLGGNMQHQADVQQQQAIGTATQQATPAYDAALGQAPAGASAQPTANNGAGPSAPATPSPSADNGTGDIFNRMIGIESGGKQFDDSGAPLTSPKGAVGVAQVMPGTAPEAAQYAGLPYDEQKYRTDPNYNAALGRAYFDHQVQTFGDPGMAAAAYNAGPGAVTDAVAKAQKSGGSYLSYLPAETQAYVQQAMGGSAGQAINAAAPQAGQSSSLPANASALSATAGTMPRIPVGPAPQMTGQAPQNQMAAALMNGGGTPGVTGSQLAAIANNPWQSEKTKELAAALANPQILHDGLGNQFGYRPGQTPTPLLKGATVGSISTPNYSGPIVMSGTPGNVRTQLATPPSNDPSHPLSGVAPIVRDAQEMANQGADSAANVSSSAGIVDKARNDAYTAKKTVGALQIANQSASQAGYGIIPNLKSFAGQYGIQTDGLSEIQAFQKSAQAVAASSPEGAAFAGAIPNLSTTPGGRKLIMQNITAIAQRSADMSKITDDDDLSTRQKAHQINGLPPAKVTMPADVLNDAKTAIAQKPAARSAIIQQIQQMGLPANGL